MQNERNERKMKKVKKVLAKGEIKEYINRAVTAKGAAKNIENRISIKKRQHNVKKEFSKKRTLNRKQEKSQEHESVYGKHKQWRV